MALSHPPHPFREDKPLSTPTWGGAGGDGALATCWELALQCRGLEGRADGSDVP